MPESTSFSRPWHPRCGALIAAVLFSTAAAAATGDSATEFNVLVSERIWFASWDQTLVDMVVTAPPTATAPPQIRAGLAKNVSSRTIPIAALGVRYGQFSASVARFSPQRFEGNGNYLQDHVSRDETDLSIGYQMVPGVAISLIRKSGKSSTNLSRSTAALVGSDTPAVGRAYLLGVSTSAPVYGPLVLYGNLAYGTGKFNDPTATFSGTWARYTVAELGLAYRLGLETQLLGVDAISVQAGYRAQSIAYRGYQKDDFARIPAQITMTESKGRSVTDGFIVSLSLIF